MQAGIVRRAVGAVAAAALLSAVPGPAARAGSPPPVGTASFSLRLYRQLVKSDDRANLVVSPYSINEALSMLTIGARGTTKTQLDTTLVGKGKTVDPSTRQALRTELTTEVVPGAGTTVTVANALWPVTGYPLTREFHDTITNSFGATARELAFGSDPAGSADTINKWASTATDGNITKLVDPSLFDQLTRLVLTNAVVFHGKWLTPFDPTKTLPAKFTLANRRTISTPTMHGIAASSASKNPRQVYLQFNTDFQLVIAMPATSTKTALDNAMATLHQPPTAGRLGDYCGDMPVSVPKWRATATFDDLPKTLKAMGISNVFADADLTGISPAAATEGLTVSDVIHQATIDVDEQGTTAAAATADIAKAVSASPRFGSCPTSVAVDRPFVYIIKNTRNQEILFAGRVDNPNPV